MAGDQLLRPADGRICGCSRYAGLPRNPCAQRQRRGRRLFEDKLAVLQHARFGRLKFYSPPLAEIPSPAGNLHLVAYLPADAHTIQAFTGLAQQGYGQVTLLESFPVEGYDEFV